MLTMPASITAIERAGRAALLVALTITAVHAAPAPDRLPAADPVIAFGDVHGDYTALSAALRKAGVVDARLGWSAGQRTVVSVGDLLDRGAESRKVLDLLMRLENEAAAAGGTLAVIVGNHEVMNLMGDLRYTSAGEFATFAGDEPAELRARMFDRYTALPANAGVDPGEIRTRFEQRYPPGWFAHRVAFAPDGTYGKWLLDRPAVLIVGDTAFVHGGLPPLLTQIDADEFNRRYRTELAGYFTAVAQLEAGGVLSPFDDADARVHTVQAWLDSAAEKGADLVAAAQSVIAADKSTALGIDAPFWYRGTALCHADTEEPVTTAALQRLGVRRVVFGHTPTPGGRVYQRFDGRAFRIDTGMNQAAYHGHPAVTVLSSAGVQALYADGTGAPVAVDPLPAYAGGENLGGIAEARLMAALEQADVGDRQPAGPDALAVSVTVDGLPVPAIYRWASKKEVARELAAWRLDRLLDIGLVPPTVARELDGRSGVLQLRPGKIESLASLQASGKQPGGSWCPLGPQYQLLYAFDTLLLNERRTPDTVLYATNDWMVMSTGHAASFDTAKRLPKQLAQTPLEPLPALIERIEHTTDAEWEAALGPLLSKREIRAVRERATLLPRTAATAATGTR
jgi:Calcineurin-like phosphoesterase